MTIVPTTSRSIELSDHPDGMFEWSAFGANYMDTYCVDGMLYDADSETGGDIPCPFCSPAAHWEYEFDGTYVSPTCSKCEKVLPNHTPLTFHDGKGLSFSADCPTCGRQKMLYRDYENVDDHTTEPECWEAREPEWAADPQGIALVQAIHDRKQEANEQRQPQPDAGSGSESSFQHPR